MCEEGVLKMKEEGKKGTGERKRRTSQEEKDQRPKKEVNVCRGKEVDRGKNDIKGKERRGKEDGDTRNEERSG